VRRRQQRQLRIVERTRLECRGARQGHGGALELRRLDGQAHDRRLPEGLPWRGPEAGIAELHLERCDRARDQGQHVDLRRRLGDVAAAKQGVAADIIQELDWSKIPNIENVDQKFRDGYTHGIPTDYGKVGIGYRSDLVSEPIASWADVWSLAEKYSGKIVFIDLERDTIGSALKYKGFSANTTDQGELDQALQALLDIKPHLQALKGYNIGSGLVKGSTVIAMDWDYDIALAQAENPDIKWVLPEEGSPAYLEGFFAIKDTPDIAVVEAFFNFFLEPKQYADFVNTTGTAYVMPSASQYVDKAITDNPALIVDAATLDKVEFEDFLGEATANYTKLWDQFKSA